MKRDIVQAMAEAIGLTGLDAGEVDRLTALTAEAETNAARLPRRHRDDEPAHVFVVPQPAPPS
jgi:hypothetical protein